MNAVALPFRGDHLAIAKRLCAPLALIALWAVVYLPNLRTSPKWYGDEFVTLIAGDAILRGHFHNRALTYSFFSTFTNYQPPGLTLYGLSAAMTGGDVVGGRLLSTALCAVLAVVCYLSLSPDLGRLTAFIASATLLLAPQHTIHFRWIYPHYLCTVAVIGIAILLRRPASPKRDWLIGSCCAVAAAGHLLVVYVVAGALLARITRPSAWPRILVPPGLVVLASLALGYLISGPQLLLDLRELAGGYADDSQRSTYTDKVINVFRFFSFDWYHVLLFSSFFALAALRRWPELALVSVISFAIIQNRPELPVFYYQSMVFVPLLGLYAIETLRHFTELGFQSTFGDSKLIRPASQLVILGIPLAFAPDALTHSLQGTHAPRNNHWVAPSIEDLEESANWINSQTESDELVVAFWDAGWMLKGRWTDLMQCAIWEYGQFPYFYNRKRGHEEFVFPADLTKARYLLVGPLDVRWLWGQGNIPKLLEEHAVLQWPIVHQNASTVVLKNPRFQLLR